jgi:hypothetical protein
MSTIKFQEFMLEKEYLADSHRHEINNEPY